MCARTPGALHFINGSQGPGIRVGGGVNTPFLMLGKGVKLCTGRIQRGKRHEEKDRVRLAVCCGQERDGRGDRK